MLRRVMLVAMLCTAGWLLAGPAAGAQTYPASPSTPASNATPFVDVDPSQVVVVQGAPSTSGGTLSLTGAPATVGLVALASGLVLFGVAIVAVTRRNASVSGVDSSTTA